MTIRVFVDESGRPGDVPPSAKRRQRLFVLAGLAVDDEGYRRLHESYGMLLRRPLPAAEGMVTIGDLFRIYKSVTGKKPEIKAGWLVGNQGPFAVLRDAPEETRRAIFLDIAAAMLDAVTSHALTIYIIVIDKYHAYRIAPR